MVPALVNAQVKKLYGYVQELQGGAMHDRNEPRKQTNTTSSGRFFLFAAISKKPVALQQVWIKGNLYTFTTDTVKKFPFILESSNGGEMISRDTLVRSSLEKIIQLKDLVITKSVHPSKKITQLVAANDVVVVFVCKGVLSSFTLKKLRPVTPLMTQ